MDRKARLFQCSRINNCRDCSAVCEVTNIILTSVNHQYLFHSPQDNRAICSSLVCVSMYVYSLSMLSMLAAMSLCQAHSLPLSMVAALFGSR